MSWADAGDGGARGGYRPPHLRGAGERGRPGGGHRNEWRTWGHAAGLPGGLVRSWSTEEAHACGQAAGGGPSPPERPPHPLLLAAAAAVSGDPPPAPPAGECFTCAPGWPGAASGGWPACPRTLSLSSWRGPQAAARSPLQPGGRAGQPGRRISAPGWALRPTRAPWELLNGWVDQAARGQAPIAAPGRAATEQRQPHACCRWLAARSRRVLLLPASLCRRRRWLRWWWLRRWWRLRGLPWRWLRWGVWRRPRRRLRRWLGWQVRLDAGS